MNAPLAADQDIRERLRHVLETSGSEWAGRPFCRDALAEIERLTSELATIQGIAATRNVNLAQIAYERDCAMVDVERMELALHKIAVQSVLQAAIRIANEAVSRPATDVPPTTTEKGNAEAK